MKKKLIWVSSIITVIIIVINISMLLYMFIQYRSLAENMKKSYYHNGKTLSEIIKVAIYNNIDITNSVQDYIYSEMIQDIEDRFNIQSKQENVKIETKGFYFSEISHIDSFIIKYSIGKSVHSISKSKELYTNIEKISGAGKYIQTIGDIPSIEYVVIQDNFGIIMATTSIDSLSSISGDSALMYSIVEMSDYFRLYKLRNKEIYEFISPIESNTVLRIGFVSEPIDNAMKESRIIFFSTLFTIISFALLIIIIIFYYSRNAISSAMLLDKEKERAGYFELMNDGIMILDRNNNIINFNINLLKILNIENINNIKDIIENNPEIKEIYYSENTFQDFEIIYGDKHLLCSSIILKDNNKKIITINDFTEIEKLKKDNQLRENQVLLSELSFKVAHELKNPLNGISIVVQRILKEIPVETDYANMLKDTLDEVNRMNKRIVDFTKFAKPIDCKFESINIKDIINESVLQFRVFFLENKINLKMDLCDCNIFADKEYMKIAFNNILTNSIESIENNGEINIIIESNEKCIIEINDNGKGMDSETLKRIFDLYFTQKENGSGIGMSTVYKIIKNHNADIKINSEFGKGTKIRMIFNKDGGIIDKVTHS